MLEPVSSSPSVDNFRRPSLLAILPEYSREQVLANDHRNWLIVGGLVFDLTDFLKIHPGGDEILLEFMGLDATSVFEDMHSPRAKLVLLKYVIGRLKQKGDAFGSRRNSRIRNSTESLHSISSTDSATNPLVDGQQQPIQSFSKLHKPKKKAIS